MAFFQFRWLRLFVRRYTSPIPQENAALWKRRLAIGYAILAWNAFGLVGYMCYTGRADWAQYYGLKSDEDVNLTPAQQWTKTLGIKTAKVYRVSGFNVTQYDIDNESGEKKTNEFVEQLKSESKAK